MGGPYGSSGYDAWRKAQEEARLKHEAEAKAMTTEEETEEVVVMDVEQRKVITWRLKQLRDAGMDYDHAVLIANDTHIDLHDACDLTRKAGDSAYAILA